MFFTIDPQILIGDPELFVGNPQFCIESFSISIISNDNLGVSDEHLGVSNKKRRGSPILSLQVSDEKRESPYSVEMWSPINSNDDDLFFDSCRELNVCVESK